MTSQNCLKKTIIEVSTLVEKWEKFLTYLLKKALALALALFFHNFCHESPLWFELKPSMLFPPSGVVSVRILHSKARRE